MQKLGEDAEGEAERTPLAGCLTGELPTGAVVRVLGDGPGDEETGVDADHAWVLESRNPSSISARLLKGCKILPAEIGGGGEVRLGWLAGVLTAISRQRMAS